MAEMDELPDELLEHIFSKVSPYRDMHFCKCVSKKWNSIVKRTIRRKLQNLYRAIKSNKMKWEAKEFSNISLRHSQASCVLDDIMYIFGGCSSTDTSFNDLLALDLNNRQFSRVSVRGKIPSPKACSTLCTYEGKLILLGGWAHPSRLTPFEPLVFINELHSFDLGTKTWLAHNSQMADHPVKFASHSATVHGDTMVVFGGAATVAQLAWSTTIYCLDLERMTWSRPPCSSPEPPPRFGQSQLYLDERHLLIIGGGKGAGFPRESHDDVWMLNMEGVTWIWQRISVQNPQWGPPNLWCHRVVKVGELLVAFSKSSGESLPLIANGCAEQRNQELRLNGAMNLVNAAAALREPENNAGRLGAAEKESSDLDLESRMNMYVADTSKVMQDGSITWHPPSYNRNNPVIRILYSLVVGNSELIMFGGMNSNGELDLLRSIKVVEDKPLNFATAPKSFI